MPPRPGEPLRKVTLNLFASDARYLKALWGEDYTVKIRELVHRYVVSQHRLFKDADDD